MEEINFASVPKKYRKIQNLSQENFGNVLCEEMADVSLTGQAISLWEREKEEPRLKFLFRVFRLYDDWRRDFAIDAIIAKMPDVFVRKNGALTVVDGLCSAIKVSNR